MLRLLIFLIAANLMSAPVRADALPVKVTISPGIVTVGNVVWNGQHTIIQSLVDTITINNVSINRGNCKILDQSANNTLKFGERKTVATFGCEIVEISIDSSEGPITITVQ